MPKHSEGTCMACGGMVDAEGYALGGLVGDEAIDGLGVAEDLNIFEEPGSTDQDEAKKRLHDEAGFARAVKGYARGGVVEDDEAEAMRKGATTGEELYESKPGMEKLDKVAEAAMKGGMSGEEMAEMKRKRYGFKGRR